MADDNGEAAEEEDGEEAEDADAVGEDEDEEVEVLVLLYPCRRQGRKLIRELDTPSRRF